MKNELLDNITENIINSHYDIFGLKPPMYYGVPEVKFLVEKNNKYYLVALVSRKDYSVTVVVYDLKDNSSEVFLRMKEFIESFSLNYNYDKKYEEMIDNIVDACDIMSRKKTGALITIQQNQDLQEYVQSGIMMGSEVSSELLCTIFQYGTPMHDGAVIIQGNKIACAAAYFPPTTRDLPSKYGARHRAAVGISEISDSITIIVSEETGNISVAMNGYLTLYSSSALKNFLMSTLVLEDSKSTPNFINSMIQTANNLTSRSKKKEKITDERIKPIKIIDNYSKGADDNGK